MPISADIYGQQVTPKFNSPFESLQRITALQAQEENARGLREQRETMAAQRREQTEKIARENADADALRAEFNRVDPATGQPIAPTLEGLSGKIGPDKATAIFKGFEALREQRTGNALKDTDILARVLGGIEALPADLRGPSYEASLGMLIENGVLKAGQAPPKYDANFVKAKRREALSVLEQFKLEAPKDDYTLGDSRMSGATNQPIATAAPKPTALGSDDFAIEQWAKARNLDPRKLSDAQLFAAKRANAQATRAPESSSGKEQWIVRAGKPVYTSNIQPGDEPLRAQLNTGDTAQDRQRDARTTAARDFLARLNELRTKINTKMGPSAGATGYARRAGAALGMDPDVAEYERIRSAGGRALAVAIMGAQNLSDQDANAWSNMLPDARTDEQTAGRLTTQVEKMLDGMTGGGSKPKAGAPNDAPAAGRVRVKGPNGETGTMPASSALPPGWSKIGG